MKHSLFPILLFTGLVLASCSNQQEDGAKEAIPAKKDSLPPYHTETVFLDTTDSSMYFNAHNPVVFANTVSVYSKPDSSGSVLSELHFNDAVEIKDMNGYWQGWYELAGKRTGFIPAACLATHVFTGKNCRYFIVNSFSPNYNPARNGFTIYRYDSAKKQFTDTFTLDKARADIVKEMSHSAWKNVDILLYTRQVDAYCGGGETELYLADANGSFTELFSTYSFYDDSEEGGGSYATVTFPKNVENDTIVYHKGEERAVYKKGRPVKNPDGSYRMESIHDTTKYYCWDGMALRKVKTITKGE